MRNTAKGSIFCENNLTCVNYDPIPRRPMVRER